MASRGSQRRHARDELARTAARLMVQSGIRDYQLAKRKAASTLGLAASGKLPSNDEIDDAICEYQRVFCSHYQPQRLAELRKAAARAMKMLEEYEPRLVGPVLTGHADSNSHITLHLCSDSVEAVGESLIHLGLSYRLSERRLRTRLECYRSFPTFKVRVVDEMVEMVVFDRTRFRHAPLSVVDARPCSRAKLAQVERLLNDDTS